MIIVRKKPRVKPKEVTTEASMNSLKVSKNVGKVYKYTGTTTTNYVNGDLYILEET